MRGILVLTIAVLMVAMSSAMILPRALAAESAIRLVPKPIDTAPERRARTQSAVPPEYEEIPFIESTPAPILTPAEQQRGYLLFQRPITEPVHPNSTPLGHERIEQIVAFATPGEYELLTFSIYPERDLRNLKVRCSALRSEAGEIPATQISVRLLTYWNMGYPRYTSRTTYRRVPELLEEVTLHSSPAGECQRYWLRVHVPEDAQPGLYRGTVTVWDDGFDRAVEIPVSLRVLDFKLEQDPAKRYSAYYYVRNRTQYAGKPESFVQAASSNEYREMVAYGLNMTPTLYLRCDDGETITLPYEEELDRMLAAGLAGPVPVTADSVIARFYREMVPDGERGSHWDISKLPPPEFYERITASFKAFEAERKAKGWPEFVCCPIDEVSAARQDFGAKVYAAVKAAGIRTYATKDPTAADAAPYRPYIDVWCSQPYSAPYEQIVAQDRYEYWSYPNHNAGEIKDRRVMCKGGRMTYGFGFWRSGYTTLIPWHWSWTPGDDQFDYLRGSASGAGQRIDEAGEVIPAVYWECFREGVDDARYLYTLQQAVFEREGAPEEDCRRAVAEGKKLLQDTWAAIQVQQKYLAEHMWPSEEFNTRRWLLARAIADLKQYPAVRSGTASSPHPTPLPEGEGAIDEAADISPVERASRAGNVQPLDLGEDFAAWSSGTAEGSIEIVELPGPDGKKELRWRVQVDHLVNGGEGGDYPMGWPRVARTFRPGELDFSTADYLSLRVRVDSNRDEVADDATRLGLTLSAHGQPSRLFERRVDLGDRQRQWIPLQFPIRELIDQAGVGPEPWRSISRVQLFISESDYAHGTDITFQIADVALQRFTSPAIERVEVPAYITLPRTRLPVAFDILGARTVRKGSHTVAASLVSADGRRWTEKKQDLAEERTVLLDTAALAPGRYLLKLAITYPDGKACAEEEQAIVAIDGPLTGL